MSSEIHPQGGCQSDGKSVRVWIKRLAQGCLRAAGLRRSNRFDAMPEMLRLLDSLGFAPRVVIDCGAHVGGWTRIARSIFPAATYHLIEPHPDCERALRELARSIPGAEVHPVAVGSPDSASVSLAGGGSGAWVVRPGEEHLAESSITCPATTLDQLLATRLARADRALLKLDLEGHEVEALKGATVVLGAVEVICTEVQFYDVARMGRPVFQDVAGLLAALGYQLFDFASLSGRRRDCRLRQADLLFVRGDSPVLEDCAWE